MTTATLLYDPETYAKFGVSEDGLTCQEWADKFHALGGRKCMVSMTVMDKAVMAAVDVEGTDKAVDYVTDCIRAREAQVA